MCTALNYNPHTLVLKKRIKVTTVENIDTLRSCLPYVERHERQSVAAVSIHADADDTRVDLDKFLDKYKFQINTEITGDQKYELLALLRQYKEVFAFFIRRDQAVPPLRTPFRLVIRSKSISSPISFTSR